MPVDDRQNSLRAAVDRILGFSPGGSAAPGSPAFGGGGGATGLGAGGGTNATALGAAGAAGAGGGGEVIAPTYSDNMRKTPFSNISGATRQSGPVYDPFAAVNAELSALKQKNAEMAASLSKPVAATAPAAVTAAAPAVRPTTAPAAAAAVPAAMTNLYGRSVPMPSYFQPTSYTQRQATPTPQQFYGQQTVNQPVAYRPMTTSMNSAQQYGTNQIYPSAYRPTTTLPPNYR
jgi:hypothetical protein